MGWERKSPITIRNVRFRAVYRWLLRAIAPHRAVVLINRAAAKRHAGTIEVDYRDGVEAVVSRLIAQGRRHFVFAAGPAYSHGGAGGARALKRRCRAMVFR